MAKAETIFNLIASGISLLEKILVNRKQEKKSGCPKPGPKKKPETDKLQ